VAWSPFARRLLGLVLLGARLATALEGQQPSVEIALEEAGVTALGDGVQVGAGAARPPARTPATAEVIGRHAAVRGGLGCRQELGHDPILHSLRVLGSSHASGSALNSLRV